MSFITKETLFSIKWFKAYSLIIFGTFIMAIGFVLFISPYKFAPGGVYGIAIVLHHLFEFPIGLTGLAIDIPLTIFGIWILGPRFGAKTITGMLALPAWMTLLEYTYGYEAFVPNQPLLSAIYGGVLVGLGLGLIFKSKATSGGSDIIAMVIGKYTHMPLGQLLMYVDSSIVLISWIAFNDPMIPLISWVIIFITGKVIDIVLEGMSYDKTLFIISDKHKEIGEKIIHDLKRSSTYIHGTGAYANSERTLLFTVLNRREATILMSYIHEIDPNAFVTILNANEVLGDGFRSLKDKVEED